ncbi:MAG: cytochrome C oxidase subunit IV family protein [Anaerolineae bacterium]|nr:cytochrome C oxidase subunit IV family protein [Anaerolineae bacterium]
MSDKPTTPKTHAEAAHAAPGEGTYFAVFLLLAILTVIELLVTYLQPIKVPLLLGLAVGKAWLVVQFYMHLRYDRRILTWSFLIPVIAGVIVTLFLPWLVTPVYR